MNARIVTPGLDQEPISYHYSCCFCSCSSCCCWGDLFKKASGSVVSNWIGIQIWQDCARKLFLK